jgi:hypothetical protein
MWLIEFVFSKVSELLKPVIYLQRHRLTFLLICIIFTSRWMSCNVISFTLPTQPRYSLLNYGFMRLAYEKIIYCNARMLNVKIIINLKLCKIITFLKQLRNKIIMFPQQQIMPQCILTSHSLFFIRIFHILLLLSLLYLRLSGVIHTVACFVAVSLLIFILSSYVMKLFSCSIICFRVDVFLCRDVVCLCFTNINVHVHEVSIRFEYKVNESTKNHEVLNVLYQYKIFLLPAY